MRFVHLSIFAILAIVLLSGCQPGHNISGNPALLVGYDDLYPSRIDTTGSSALYHYSVARLAGMEGDLDTAAKSLEQAVAADPESAYLLIALAEAYMHLDEHEKAIRAIEDALIRDPDLLQGHLLLANLMALRDNYPESIHHLERAAEIEPDNEPVRMQLALFYNRIGEIDKSIATLKTIVAMSPENSYALLALARAYAQIDFVPQAEQAYMRILEFNPESFLAISELGKLYGDTGRKDREVAFYISKMQEFPDNNRLRHRLAGTYVEQDRLDMAMAELLVILEKNPEDTTALRKAGLLSIESGKWTQAVGYFRRLTEVDSTDSQAYYYLGVSFEEGGAWEQALAVFSQIDDDSAVYDDSIIHRGYNLHKLSRTIEAIQLLEKNRERLSARSEIYDYLSYLYVDSGQRSAALEVVIAGLKLYPDDETLLYRRIVLHDQMGDKDASDEVARQLLHVNPEHINALNYLAYSYAVRNIRLDEALVMAQKALAGKDAYYIRDTLGWILFRLGRFDEALTEIELAIAEKPDDPVILEHFGDVLQALGRDEEALSAFQRAVPVPGGGESPSESLLKKIRTLEGERN